MKNIVIAIAASALSLSAFAASHAEKGGMAKPASAPAATKAAAPAAKPAASAAAAKPVKAASAPAKAASK